MQAGRREVRGRKTEIRRGQKKENLNKFYLRPEMRIILQRDDAGGSGGGGCGGGGCGRCDHGCGGCGAGRWSGMVRMRVMVGLLLLRRTSVAGLLGARMVVVLRRDGRSRRSGMVVTDVGGIRRARWGRGAVHVTVNATMMMVERRSESVNRKRKKNSHVILGKKIE